MNESAVAAADAANDRVAELERELQLLQAELTNAQQLSENKSNGAIDHMTELEAHVQEMEVQLANSEQLVEKHSQDAAMSAVAVTAASAASERVIELEGQVQELESQTSQSLQQFEQQSQDAQVTASEIEHLQAECNKLRDALEASSDAHGKAREELGRATEAHASERQRADEISSQLGGIQSAHEGLFTKYSVTLEELDSLRGENTKASSMCNQLQTSLDEERRLRQEREAAPPPGPTQLSVSDVLISVTFDGVSTALVVRPWDTNFADVVDAWLNTTQRSTQLQPSLVRYLKHVEDTAEVYPIRVDAKLHEVHAQFAI
jgi:chromosome segregation ATPase